jgi:hypothetical protein
MSRTVGERICEFYWLGRILDIGDEHVRQTRLHSSIASAFCLVGKRPYIENRVFEVSYNDHVISQYRF